MSTALASLDHLYDRQFWRDFASDMHVEDVDFMRSQYVFNIEDHAANVLRALMLKEGYFQLQPQQWNLPLAGMAARVVDLDAAGLPVPFAFIYDEFWCLYFRLNKIIETVLGPGFVRLPDFWTWLIKPQQSETGWQPHRDRHYKALFEDRTPKAVTVWLPLTDATPLNGCMYILPAYRDPVYGTPQDKEARFDPPDIRALPALAGSILCWNQAVLHWGSHASERETKPRISVAFEFQSAKCEPFNKPVTSPSEIPGFLLRLKLVAKQILQYRHMYPLSSEIEKLANDIMARE
jgi:hypothetical protein